MLGEGDGLLLSSPNSRPRSTDGSFIWSFICSFNKYLLSCSTTPRLRPHTGHVPTSGPLPLLFPLPEAVLLGSALLCLHSGLFHATSGRVSLPPAPQPIPYTSLPFLHNPLISWARHHMMDNAWSCILSVSPLEGELPRQGVCPSGCIPGA